MNILAVIPARGGSKGIPRKNLRLLNGHPLLHYAIANARACPLIQDVAVTSDEEEILTVAQKEGAVPLLRDPQLARDAVTLDPVIHDALLQMERQTGRRYDVVVTLQPTSPTLKASTLQKALETFVQGEMDSLISVVNQPHLAWSKGEQGYYPLYEKRLNRQQLPPNYVEAGAFLLSRREWVTPQSRLGERVSVFEISPQEGIDIDSPQDWVQCQAILQRKKILFRADGYQALGMGHIYHCLTLAYHLMGHEVLFVTKVQHVQGVQKIQQAHMPLRTFHNQTEFFSILEQERPDVLVHDCLDTTPPYMQALKERCPRVVTMEDLGEGAKYADVVINALYDRVPPWGSKVYTGEDYVCLREEFLLARPKDFSPQVRQVLVLFGGTDPSNLTGQVYALAQKLVAQDPQLRFTFVVGLGYDWTAHGVLPRSGIDVLQNVSLVSAHMEQADLAFTSQGRTVYELASLGVPAIVLAQNQREQLHTFAQMHNGFLNLGLGSRLTQDTLEQAFAFLTNTPQLRQEMRQLMLAHRDRLCQGVENEIRLILGG